jgi:hypothetical protein
MKIELQHNFKTKCHSLPALFDGVQKMSQLMQRIQKLSERDPLNYDPDKYKGDAFEFFVELFLLLHPCDNRTGVYNYSPTQDNDNGVDGIGINIKGQPSVVQVKYRSNPQEPLTANRDHLSNMFVDGQLSYGVIADTQNKKNYRHFIFTTASGLHFYTETEMFKNKVRCFGFKNFRSMLDNNIVFWNTAREIVAEL